MPNVYRLGQNLTMVYNILPRFIKKYTYIYVRLPYMLNRPVGDVIIGPE